jgi:hypothetical protein
MTNAVTGRPINISGWRGVGKQKSEIYSTVQLPVAGNGRYIASTEAEARDYGDKVTQETMRLDSPLVVRTDDEWRALTREAGWRFPNPFGHEASTVEKITGDLRALVQNKGHDGLVILPPGNERYGKTLGNVFTHAQAIEYGKPSTAVVSRPSPTTPVVSGETPSGTTQPARPGPQNAMTEAQWDDLFPADRIAALTAAGIPEKAASAIQRKTWQQLPSMARIALETPQVEAAALTAQSPAVPAESQAAPYPDYMPDGGKPISGNRWRIVDGQGRIVGVADGSSYGEANANAQAGRIINPTSIHRRNEAANATKQPSSDLPRVDSETRASSQPGSRTVAGSEGTEPTAPRGAGTGAEGEGAAVGDSTSIEIPGAQPIPARYEVRELADIKASHRYVDGAPVPTTGYPAGLQPRDYKIGNDEDTKVKRQAGSFKPSYLISDHPDATSGPSVVTQDGTVINGNSRVTPSGD